MTVLWEISMTNRFIGVDPGSKGAIAVIDENSDRAYFIDLEKDYRPYEWAMYCLQDDSNSWRNTVVTVEDVCGRPGQSCSANTTFMKLAGMAELTGHILATEFSLVKPQVWKKHYGLIFPKTVTKTEKKHHSVELARELFPDNVDSLLMSKDGRAEALLLAEYGRRKFYERNTSGD